MAKEYPKRNMAPKEDIELLLTTKFDDFKKVMLTEMRSLMNEVTDVLHARIEELENKVENFAKKTQINEKKIKELSAKCKEVESQNNELKARLKCNIKETTDLEERLEDNINRQMRKTLVFSNFKQASEEKKEDVPMLLANKISELSDGEVTPGEAFDFIERAHRGKAKKNGERQFCSD